jgi:hypothetical protein
MRLGLIAIGILFLIGGGAGVLRSTPSQLAVPPISSAGLSPSVSRDPLNANARAGGYVSMAVGVLIVGSAFLVRGIRTPEPHDNPPVESQPYV